jgi:hypothetical protein
MHLDCSLVCFACTIAESLRQCAYTHTARYKQLVTSQHLQSSLYRMHSITWITDCLQVTIYKLCHYCSIVLLLLLSSDRFRHCAAATEPSTAVHTTDIAAGTTLMLSNIAALLLTVLLLLLLHSCASTTAKPPDLSAASTASVRAVAGVQRSKLVAAVYATAAPRACSSSTDT